MTAGGPADTVARSAGFYDRWTELFAASFGPIFQAGLLPGSDPAATVVWLAERAGIEPGSRLLDAGCGVCGPAIAVAGAIEGVAIDAVTNSPVQASMARRNVAAAGLADRVRVSVADYHHLPFAPGTFDHVVLFETIGYSHDLSLLAAELSRVLTPGGGVYVKDVFRRAGPLDDEQRRAMADFDELWGCVRSPTMDEAGEALRQAGFTDVAAAELDLSTERLLGAMFRFADGGIRPSPLGVHFYRPGPTPPVVFGEVKATAPAA